MSFPAGKVLRFVLRRLWRDTGQGQAWFCFWFSSLPGSHVLSPAGCSCTHFSNFRFPREWLAYFLLLWWTASPITGSWGARLPAASPGNPPEALGHSAICKIPPREVSQVSLCWLYSKFWSLWLSEGSFLRYPQR